jgi:hypothetical protein
MAIQTIVFVNLCENPVLPCQTLFGNAGAVTEGLGWG